MKHASLPVDGFSRPARADGAASIFDWLPIIAASQLAPSLEEGGPGSRASCRRAGQGERRSLGFGADCEQRQHLEEGGDVEAVRKADHMAEESVDVGHCD